jgi:GNAT superfamily N-acetyltransferase
MLYEIKKLSQELANDYIDFFENSAFCDDSEFVGCYCTWYNWNDDYENQRNKCCESKRKSFKKDLAYNWILQGKLNGFLAYYNGIPIGWCNVDDKQNYDRLSMCNNSETWINSNYHDIILSIVCFIVSPNMRGKGVATALLKEVCLYAEKLNYQYIEAYPSDGDFLATNYHGQYSTYKKLGFQLVGNSKIGLVVRKFL